MAGGLLVAALLSIWVRRRRLELRPRITRLSGLAVVAFASLVVVTLSTDVIPDEIEPLADYVFIAIGVFAITLIVIHSLRTETGASRGK